MTLAWTEGFEIHQSMTYLARKYAVGSGSFSTQTGRLFGSAGSGTNLILTTPSFGVENTWVVGFGIKINTSVPTTTITLLSGASEQCKLIPTTSGGGYVWVLKRGSTTILIRPRHWHPFLI